MNVRVMWHVLMTNVTVVGSLFAGQCKAIGPWSYFSGVRDGFSTES